MNHTGKQMMALADEAKLGEWMSNHAAVSILVTDRPWEIERLLLAGGEPVLPINIQSRAPIPKRDDPAQGARRNSLI